MPDPNTQQTGPSPVAGSASTTPAAVPSPVTDGLAYPSDQSVVGTSGPQQPPADISMVKPAQASPYSTSPLVAGSTTSVSSASSPVEQKGSASAPMPVPPTVPAVPTADPAKASDGKPADSSLSTLAKKLASWKDDFMKDDKKGDETKPVATQSGTNPSSPAVVPAVQPAVNTTPNTTPNTDALSELEKKQKAKDELVTVKSSDLNENKGTPIPVSAPKNDTTESKPVVAAPKPTPVSLTSMPVPSTVVTPASPLTMPGSGPAKPVTKVESKPVATVVPATKNGNGKYPYSMEDLLSMVVEKDASDLHISVGYPAMIRIDGDLVNVGQEIVTDEIAEVLITPILPESKRELLEVNREVDLAYSFKDQARFRVNTFYERGHISAALRLIPSRIRTIEELKLPGSYHQLANLPQGLVLVTGPTGHGKSTTLAAIMQEINENQPKHIVTIEDPIEYIYPPGRALVDQREMHEDTHSWEIALRSAMRQDPDVVLVGEMRDFETIAAAITLAETGHLVFATLHTNSAAQTIDRLIDVFPEHQQAQIRVQLSNILEAIISQRLVPVKGGGRRAVSEVLLATPAVRNLIREGKSHQIDNVIRTSVDVGMKSLEQSLVELVREGVITVELAEANAVHPEEIVRLMK